MVISRLRSFVNFVVSYVILIKFSVTLNTCIGVLFLALSLYIIEMLYRTSMVN